MAKRASMTDVAEDEEVQATPTFSKEAAASAVNEAIEYKADQAEAQGTYAKFIRDKSAELGVEPAALTFALKLKRMDDIKAQSLMRSILLMTDAAGLFDQLDIEQKGALDAMREIVTRFDNVKSGLSPDGARLN